MHEKKKTILCRPLFVVKKCSRSSKGQKSFNLTDTCSIFIDDVPRVYQSWRQFLDKNKLPKCTMYCPANGKYKGEMVGTNQDGRVQLSVLLEVYNSPACSIVRKFLVGSDRTKTAVSIGSTATLVAAAIPGVFVAPALIVAAAAGGLAVGAYSVGRSVANLRDRKKHDQVIVIFTCAAIYGV